MLRQPSKWWFANTLLTYFQHCVKEIKMTTAVFTIIIIAFIAVVVLSCSRQHTPQPAANTPPNMPIMELDATPDKPIGFGYKNAWLAIRTEDPSVLAEVLGLRDLKPANWRTGLNSSYERHETHVFVTPPVEGWVFVVGIALPDTGDSSRPDRCTPILEALGKKYEHVYFFGTHRVVDFHAWARVDNGLVSRAYAYLGEQGVTIWDKGEKTKEEVALKFNFLADEPTELQRKEYRERGEHTSPKEEDVIKIAEAWTMNPLRIDEMDLPPSVGLVGRVPSEWR